MITVTKDRFVPFSKVYAHNKAIFYSDLFSGKISEVVTKNPTTRAVNALIDGMHKLTGKVYRFTRDHENPSAIISMGHIDVNMINSSAEKITANMREGSVLIFGNDFLKDFHVKIVPTKASNSNVIINLREINPVEYVFLNTQLRFKNREKVMRSFEKSGDIEDRTIHYGCLTKYMHDNLVLGAGDYGSVYKADIRKVGCAIKFSKIKADALQKPFSKNFSSWHEILILKNILTPLIKNRICPNFPLMYDYFYCSECKLKLRKKREKSPCAVMIMELASGDLRDFSHTFRSTAVYNSALFQIMAAVHAIQLYGQIMNFDIKKENILYYDVLPGGYWKYIIHGQEYYVPNLGQMFVVNDFGLSRCMSPKFKFHKNDREKTFRLGHRFGILMNGVFSPLITTYQPDTSGTHEMEPEKITWKTEHSTFISHGSEFRMSRLTGKVYPVGAKLTSIQKEFLTSHGIPANTTSKKFFMFPEIIPPFEYFNDTQDVIRMFVGGKRTTQNGKHSAVKTDKLFLENLGQYKSRLDTLDKRFVFSTNPEKILAGQFIDSYFSKFTEFTRPPPAHEKIIGIFKVS